jgi:hypothetical protein
MFALRLLLSLWVLLPRTAQAAETTNPLDVDPFTDPKHDPRNRELLFSGPTLRRLNVSFCSLKVYTEQSNSTHRLQCIWVGLPSRTRMVC